METAIASPFVFCNVRLCVEVDADKKVWIQAASAWRRDQCGIHQSYAPKVYEKLKLFRDALSPDGRKMLEITFTNDQRWPCVIVTLIRKPCRDSPRIELSLDAARNPALERAARELAQAVLQAVSCE